MSRGPVRTAVVTDSTAYLPDGLADRHGVRVVPLHVVLGGVSGTEGIEVGPSDVARALRERRTTVTTSRPSPAELSAAYREALDGGVDSVVSVHLSAELSGTFEAARLAAAEWPDGRIHVVDSRSAAMGLGYAVLAAAERAAAGDDAAAVVATVNASVAATTLLFYVDTLEHLRRGGRIGAAAALLGTALSVKPILHVVDGAVVPRERVRTAGRGMTQLGRLAVVAAGDAAVDVAVHHLGVPERAEMLAARLRESLPRLRRLVVSELGAAVGAHVGPGALGVVVVRRD